MARSEYRRCPPRWPLWRGVQAAVASEDNHTVTSAAANEGPVVGRPIRNAVLRLIRGMNLRLHPCSVAPAEDPQKRGPSRPTRSGSSCNNAVQRCQVHKRRNVLEYLPEVQRPWVKATLTRTYTHTDVKAARRLLQDLPGGWTSIIRVQPPAYGKGSTRRSPWSSCSSRSGLRRSLATTNAVESLLSRTRHVKRNVKRWRGGTMVLRWVAAGVLEAAKGFRRVKGCRDMPVLVAALRARDAQLGLDESSGMVA